MLLFASRNAGKRACACVGVWLVLVKKAKSSDCCGSLLPLQTLFLWIRICPLTRFTGPIGARIKSPSSSVAKFQSCAHRSDNLTLCKNYRREKAGNHVVHLEVRKVGMQAGNSIVLSISHKEPRAESIWPKTLKISVTSHSAGSKGFAWVCTKWTLEGGGRLHDVYDGGWRWLEWWILPVFWHLSFFINTDHSSKLMSRTE